jgi:hypothetical protein
MHEVFTASNLCSATENYATVIDNPLTNGNPDAILLVTPNYCASDGSQNNAAAGPAKDIPAVFYANTGVCGTANEGRWVIYNLNSTPMVNQTYYNVMVVNP